MQLLEPLQTSPLIFATVVGVFGLVIGSFLNVLTLRLPLMLERKWRRQCEELAAAPQELPSAGRFDLIHPGSHCPHCQHAIAPWENIPVISFLLLRGRCAACRQPISIRYPLVELLTALLSAVVAWRFGLTGEGVAALVLTWALISLTIIDFDHQLLPDTITLPVLWLGLGLSLFDVFADSHAAIVGAVVGYLSLWALYKVHRALTGKEGMGYGDFKLLALLGAWLGWQSLPMVLLLASLVGATVGIWLITSRGDRDIRIPFGPYLATAGWIALLWGEEIAAAYQRWSGTLL